MAKIGALTRVINIRRQRLITLLDEIGPAELERKTGLAASYLRSMSLDRATTKTARNISDENAALIESKAGKPEGWLSGRESSRVAETAPVYGGQDRTLLRSAIVRVERAQGGLTKPAAELRADIILGAYDVLLTGASEDAVDGFLSGIQFARPNHASKA